MALHAPKKRGKCVWCGQSCEGEKTRWGGARQNWHNACRDEFDVILFPDRARVALFKRDQGICCDCGEDWSEMSVFRPAYPVAAEFVPQPFDPQRFSAGPKPGTFCQVSREYYETDGKRPWPSVPYVDLLVISLWHADHKVPLWKARNLPDLERLEFFKLANLVTRCHRCHERKTSEEAAERAHFDRLAQIEAPKPKSKWASRPMGKRPPGAGNGFPPKGSTPMRRKR